MYVLKNGEKPEASVPKFSAISGMDLAFWRKHYLVGEAEEVAARVCEKVVAMDGVGHVVFNPVDWSMEQLEMLANDIRPLIQKALAR